MRDAGSEPVVVVSNDTHIGPRLIEDLRPYCPSKHLDDFDRFAAAAVTEKDVAPRSLTAGTTGLPEPGSRLRGLPSNAYFLGELHSERLAFGVDLGAARDLLDLQRAMVPVEEE